MKKSVENAGKISFLNFTFNPKSRTLQQGSNVLQLRKKQSDVLELLCERHPEPVSKAEFLDEVWGGGYVTSQSIAQIICSLRGSLEDNNKSIIVTIPKLGYQLTTEPCWEKNESEKETISVDSYLPKTGEFDKLSLSRPSYSNVIPDDNVSVSILPDLASRTAQGKNKFKVQTLFISVVAVLFFSLIFVARTVKNNSLSFISNHRYSDQKPLTKILSPLSDDFFYYCNKAEGAACHPKTHQLNAQCPARLYKS